MLRTSAQARHHICLNEQSRAVKRFACNSLKELDDQRERPTAPEQTRRRACSMELVAAINDRSFCSARPTRAARPTTKSSPSPDRSARRARDDSGAVRQHSTVLCARAYTPRADGRIQPDFMDLRRGSAFALHTATSPNMAAKRYAMRAVARHAFNRLDGILPDIEIAALAPLIDEIEQLKSERNAVCSRTTT